MTFEGNAPTVGTGWANNVPSTLVVYYHQGATGQSSGHAGHCCW